MARFTCLGRWFLQRFKRKIITALYFLRFSPHRAVLLCRLRRESERCLPKGARFHVPLGVTTTIELRAGTTDFDIFEQIVVLRDCALPFEHNPRLIIDGGSHIGCSVIWFARQYPKARIIAVEAQRENFEILMRNTNPYPNIQCIYGAIWSSKGKLRLQNPKADPWGFRVTASDLTTATDLVDGIMIEDLLVMSGEDRIGILKLDIEGAEREVFSGECDGWLSRTEAIIIELHERFEPGATAAFDGAVKRHAFQGCRSTRHNRIMRMTTDA